MGKEVKVIFRVDEDGDWEQLVFHKNKSALDDGLENYYLTAEDVLDKMAELGITYFIKEEIREND